MRRAARFAVVLALLAPSAAALADTLKVLTAGAFKQVIVAMAPAFEAKTRHRLDVQNDTAGALAKRVDAGEAFDVIAVTPAVLRDLAAKGRVVPESVASAAKVGIGVAVKAGAPAPDIGTVDAFRKTVLDARAVAYIDPAAGGSSGIYLAGLFERLGVAAPVKAKAVLVPGGLVATRVVSGEADLAIHQVSEILPVAGATLVGPLPEPIQNYTEYAVAVGTASPRKDAAKALVALLAGPDAAATIRAAGMVPASPAPR